MRTSSRIVQTREKAGEHTRLAGWFWRPRQNGLCCGTTGKVEPAGRRRATRLSAHRRQSPPAPRRAHALPGTAAAFTLVEVTLALGVAGFCLLAIFGLLPLALRSNQAALEQTAANGILSAVAADLRATPLTTPPGQAATSQQFTVPIPANPVTSAPAATTRYFTSDGKSATSLAATSRYLLTVTFLPNGTNAKTATFVNLQVTWPAAAAVANAVGSVQTFVALNRN